MAQQVALVPPRTIGSTIGNPGAADT